MTYLTPVLIVAPYFAPQSHAAMFRAHKLAKYLPEHGYRPIVLTTDVNYLYNEDPDLLVELPDIVEIHRARYVEPTMRGLRMALGGRDRSFLALKRTSVEKNDDPIFSPNATNPHEDMKGRSKLLRASYGAALDMISEWPDRHWTWSRPLHKMARTLIRKNGIRLLYTTTNPISPLAVAVALKREFDLTWVCDCRDPIGYGRKHTASGMWRQALERRYIQRAMDMADMVTGLADSYGSIFFDLYGLPPEKYRFIPTGIDDAYLSSHDDESRNGDLLFVGEVMANQSPYVFEVLNRAAVQYPAAFEGLGVTFLGRSDINGPLAAKLLSGVEGWSLPVEVIDHVPQREVYRRMQSARACLLVPGERGYWWNNFAKLVDYIGLNVPVIADVPATSEARSELTRAGNAFFLSGEIESDASALATWLDGGPIIPVLDYSKRYTAQRQVANFSALFDALLEARDEKRPGALE